MSYALHLAPALCVECRPGDLLSHAERGKEMSYCITI